MKRFSRNLKYYENPSGTEEKVPSFDMFGIPRFPRLPDPVRLLWDSLKGVGSQRVNSSPPCTFHRFHSLSLALSSPRVCTIRVARREARGQAFPRQW